MDALYAKPWLLVLIVLGFAFALVPTLIVFVWAIGWLMKLTIDVLSIVGWAKP